MPLNVAFIEPESELIDVSGKMLRSDVMIGAVDAPFQDGKDALVGRCIAPRELRRAVIDGLIGEAIEAAIGANSSAHARARLDVLADFIVDHIAVCGFNWGRDNAASDRSAGGSYIPK
jgi:hypothetical protein